MGEQAKDDLIKSISTKFTTATIGPLSVLEQHFGFLWGQGKPRHLLTEDELSMWDIKEKVRTEVLNIGNNQKRAAVAAINDSWK